MQQIRTGSAAVLLTVLLSSGMEELCAQPSSWSKVVQLEIVAPAKKANGVAWDAEIPFILPIPGSPMPTLGNPSPDMMVYLFDSDGAMNPLNSRSGQQRAARDGSVPCPDSLLCIYNGVAIPPDYFGIVILDIDMKQHDHMLSSVVRVQKEEDSDKELRIEQHIHAFLNRMRAAGQLGGAPADGSELISASLEDCMVKGCFGDSLMGTPLIKASVSSAGSSNGVNKKCGMVMSGEISLRPAPGEVEVAFDFSQNACRAPGRTMITWDFGDGRRQFAEPNVAISHTYAAPGDYKVSATPQCVREITTCDAPPALAVAHVK